MTKEMKDVEFDLFDLALISKAVSYILDTDEDLTGTEIDAFEELSEKCLSVIMSTALKQRRQNKNGDKI